MRLFDVFLQIVPSNLVRPFSENNVIAVLFLVLLFSLAVISLVLQLGAVLERVFKFKCLLNESRMYLNLKTGS